MDDRTPEERAGKINKSRYDSIDLYISRKEELIPERYNDIPVAADKEAYKRLIDAGEKLATHSFIDFATQKISEKGGINVHLCGEQEVMRD